MKSKLQLFHDHVRARERFGKLTGFDSDSYKAWRATILFTNEEIASVYDKMVGNDPVINENCRKTAARIRAGQLNSYQVNIALRELVKVCNVCGRLAHYRRGSLGLCSKHRDVKFEKDKQLNANRAIRTASFNEQANANHNKRRPKK